VVGAGGLVAKTLVGGDGTAAGFGRHGKDSGTRGDNDM
jgi:hypothetical protein